MLPEGAEGNGAGGTPPGQEQKPGAEGTPDIKDLAGRLAAIENENKGLKEQLGKTTEEATTAKQYLGNMIDQLRQRAQEAGKSPAEAQQIEDYLRKKFDDDPVGAMNDLFHLRMEPIMNEYLGNTVAQNRALAKERGGETWNKYEKEIDEFMRDMPDQVKAKPGSWESALRYVRANHIDEEIADAKKAATERGAQSEGASAPAPKTSKPELDPLEKQMAKEFNLSEEEWVKFRNTQEAPA